MFEKMLYGSKFIIDTILSEYILYTAMALEEYIINVKKAFKTLESASLTLELHRYSILCAILFYGND